MNDRAKGQQQPRQRTGMWVAEDRKEIKERGGPSYMVAGQITIIVIIIVKVMALHAKDCLSVFHGLLHLMLIPTYFLGIIIIIIHHFTETRTHFLETAKEGVPWWPGG